MSPGIASLEESFERFPGETFEKIRRKNCSEIFRRIVEEILSKNFW